MNPCPFQEAPRPPMTDELYEACHHAAHVILPGGERYRAGRATLIVLENLGWGVWARMIRRSPLVYLVELGYLIFSRNRPFFSKFVFTKEHDES